jgi:chromosome segregation ATPase
MFDALKRVIETGRVRNPADRLEQLIQSARDERAALTDVLTALASRSAEVTEVRDLFRSVDRKAGESTAHLDALATRLRELESRTAVLASMDGRIQQLADIAAQARRTADALMAPDGEMARHRQELQRLASLTAETRAAASALEQERAAIDECRSELSRSRSVMTVTAGEAQQLRTEVEGLHTLAGTLAAECTALRQATRDADQGSKAATTAVEQLEHRLAQVAQIQRVGEVVEERLASLHSLAEHVFQKTRALEDQKQTLDRASLEANRLNEMVWTMDSQITKLGEAVEEASETRETLMRVESLAAEAEQKLDIALKLRNECAIDTSRFERDGRALVESVRAAIEKLALDKTHVDVLDRRLGAVQTSLEGAEARMNVLEAREQDTVELRKRIDAVAGAVGAVDAQAQELADRQAGLQMLGDRLAQVDALARQTSIRYDGLLQTRSEIDSLRREVQEVRKSHAEMTRLRERLAADSTALEQVADRVAALRGQAPAIETDINMLLEKLGRVEGASRQAERLADVANELDARLVRTSARLEFVDGLEARINSLQRMSGDVDRRLGEQLSRRAELDALRMSLDGSSAQARDLLGAVDALQTIEHRLLPLEERVRTLADQIQATGMGLEEVRGQESALADRRLRLEVLVEQSRSLDADISERQKQTQALADTLDRSVAARDGILSELADIESRQRDALTRSASAEDHVGRLEGIVRSLEARHAHLVSAEGQLSRVEARFAALSKTSDDIDNAMRQLADREAIVLATRTEVDRIYQAGIRSREDFQYVSERREEVAALRLKIDALLSATADADDKVAAIQSRHAAIDLVQAKATLVANLLEDLRVTLESLEEQKAVVDHVAVKLARLEFITQEAQNTIRSLQHERELTQRMERQFPKLRGPAAPAEPPGESPQFVATARDE